MKTKTAHLVSLAFLVALPWRALADDARAPGAAARAGSDLYYARYVEPALRASREQAIREYHNPVLYDPAGTAPLYVPIPERTVWQHRGPGVVLVAGDMPATPLEWNDTPRYEMFRVYLAR